MGEREGWKKNSNFYKTLRRLHTGSRDIGLRYVLIPKGDLCECIYHAASDAL